MPDLPIRPALFIQLFHTGIFPDGRVNQNPVQVTDLDVGYENQNRKVPVYVPYLGSIIIPASSRSMLSFQEGAIAKFCSVGILRAKMFYQPERYTHATRPPASDYPIGVAIWNEDEHSPNFSDGVAWVSFAAGGPPAPHESSHATGGFDALTVDPTTATNNANTTGLTVNSATAAINVNDPGHVHGLTDPGHSHTVNATTATNIPIALGFHETIGRINADFRTVGTIDQSVATSTPSEQTAHLRTMDVTFPAGWAGGTVTVNGIGPLGEAVSEVHTKPVGGGLTSGVRSFAVVTNYVNSAPGGAPGTTASVSVSNLLGVSNYPVAAFLKASIDGNVDSFLLTDLVNGTFDVTGAHVGNHTVEVWYTININHTQNSHTHTVNSSTTGATATSHTTGISVSDTGHSHATTDPGHGHAQNAHAHNLT